MGDLLMIGNCPWCGEPASIVAGAATGNRGAQWRCDHCDARGPIQCGKRGAELPSAAASHAFWSKIQEADHG